MKASVQLRLARAISTHPDTCTTGWFARDADGCTVLPDNDNACRWCALGAAALVTDTKISPTGYAGELFETPAVKYLEKAARRVSDTSVASIHDEGGKRQIEQMWAVAIELAEADEAQEKPATAAVVGDSLEGDRTVAHPGEAILPKAAEVSLQDLKRKACEVKNGAIIKAPDGSNFKVYDVSSTHPLVGFIGKPVICFHGQHCDAEGEPDSSNDHDWCIFLRDENVEVVSEPGSVGELLAALSPDNDKAPVQYKVLKRIKASEVEAGMRVKLLNWNRPDRDAPSEFDVVKVEPSIFHACVRLYFGEGENDFWVEDRIDDIEVLVAERPIPDNDPANAQGSITEPESAEHAMQSITTDPATFLSGIALAGLGVGIPRFDTGAPPVDHPDTDNAKRLNAARLYFEKTGFWPSSVPMHYARQLQQFEPKAGTPFPDKDTADRLGIVLDEATALRGAFDTLGQFRRDLAVSEGSVLGVGDVEDFPGNLEALESLKPNEHRSRLCDATSAEENLTGQTIRYPQTVAEIAGDALERSRLAQVMNLLFLSKCETSTQEASDQGGLILREFNVSNYLQDPSDAAEYLSQVLEDGDPEELVQVARGDRSIRELMQLLEGATEPDEDDEPRLLQIGIELRDKGETFFRVAIVVEA